MPDAEHDKYDPQALRTKSAIDCGCQAQRYFGVPLKFPFFDIEHGRI